MNILKRLFFFLIILLAGLSVTWGLQFYKKRYANNVKEEGFVIIRKGSNLNTLLDSIKGKVKDLDNFTAVAIEKGLNEHYKPGRYLFKQGMSSTQLVQMIKAGDQTADTFRIGDFSDVYQMIGKVTKKTELDSAQFIKGLEDIALKKGYRTAEDLKPFFFMDTYQFFWTVTPQAFFSKFEEQYHAFWTAERQQKEQALELTREQIYALASIVYKESGGKPDEQKTIAGLYLNRYHKGMKLQSDPTVIYAVNQANHFSTKIKRVLYKDLKTPSPYNTYANAGIPPGPICVVDKSSVEAVLNAEKNNYIFMCADPKRLGYHLFTDNAAQHAQNAKAYQDWLNQKNIKN